MGLIPFRRTRRELDEFEGLVESHLDSLYGAALRYTKNPAQAEDLVQDVFMKLLDRVRPPRHLRPYVFRMIRNAAIDRARRRQASPESLFDPDLLPREAPDRDLMPWLQRSQAGSSDEQKQGGSPPTLPPQTPATDGGCSRSAA